MPGYATALRNTMMDALTAAIDAGVSAGFLRYYDGVQPSTGGAATTLLAELTMSDPSAAASVSGVWTASSITSDPSANASGTFTWARLVDSTGTFVADFTGGGIGSGKEIIIDNPVIVAGQTVGIGSLTITEGNP